MRSAPFFPINRLRALDDGSHTRSRWLSVALTLPRADPFPDNSRRLSGPVRGEIGDRNRCGRYI
jgi:hypothetical protein